MADPGYWPWWAGGLGLGAAAVSHLLLAGRPLGVSGVYARLVGLRDELKREREQRAVFGDLALRRSLIAETLADMRASGAPADALAEVEAAAAQPAPAPAPASSVALGFVSLGCIALGALLSAALDGSLSLRWRPDPLHVSAFHSEALSFAALFSGGLLVGLGTRLGGGCTSGHGLSGCGRLQPASLVATALFFAAGVGASLLLAAVMR